MSAVVPRVGTKPPKWWLRREQALTKQRVELAVLHRAAARRELFDPRPRLRRPCGDTVSRVSPDRPKG